MHVCVPKPFSDTISCHHIGLSHIGNPGSRNMNIEKSCIVCTLNYYTLQIRLAIVYDDDKTASCSNCGE